MCKDTNTHYHTVTDSSPKLQKIVDGLLMKNRIAFSSSHLCAILKGE